MNQIYLVVQKLNRDDAAEVIASESCYATEIIGAFANEDLAKAGALEAKHRFFDGFEFNPNQLSDEDPYQDDTVYAQAHDGELEVYAEDYPYCGVYGDFAVSWSIVPLAVAEQ